MGVEGRAQWDFLGEGEMSRPQARASAPVSTDPGADYKGDWSQISFETELVEFHCPLSEVRSPGKAPLPAQGGVWTGGCW